MKKVSYLSLTRGGRLLEICLGGGGRVIPDDTAMVGGGAHRSPREMFSGSTVASIASPPSSELGAPRSPESGSPVSGSCRGSSSHSRFFRRLDEHGSGRMSGAGGRTGAAGQAPPTLPLASSCERAGSIAPSKLNLVS